MKRIIITALLATLSMAGVQSVNCETKKVILYQENIQKTASKKKVETGAAANQKVIQFLQKVANTKCPKKGAEKNGLTYTYDSAGEVIKVADTAYTLHVSQLQKAGQNIPTNQENEKSSKTQSTPYQIVPEGPNPKTAWNIDERTFTSELQTIDINVNSPVWVVTRKDDSENILAFAQSARIRAEGVLDKLEGGCLLGTLAYGTIRAMDLVLRWNPPQFRPEVEEILTKEDKSSPFRAIVQSKWCYVLNAAALGWSLWKLSDVLSNTRYEIKKLA